MDDLSRDLASLYGPAANRIEIPGDVDASVRAAIRSRARARARRRPAPGWLAAASLILVAGVVFTIYRGGRGPAGDVDRSGHIDILDAFALSRLIERGVPPDTHHHDVNGDGMIDSADVDAIAMRAVALPEDTS